MKTKLITASIALAGLMSVAATASAQSINVSVKGTITPAACIPVLSGGGVVDYGNIPASTLNMSTFNILPKKAVAFSVTCAAATKIAVSVVDNRLASIVPGAVAAIRPDLLDVYNFGLGTVSGANVGGYTLSFDPASFTVDGVSPQSIASSNNGVTWVGTGGYFGPNYWSSWGVSPAAGPISGKTFAGTLSVQAVLNKGSALPLTAAVPLDGNATMTINYL